MLVVGLGAAGSASLVALARRGVECIGIDRFSPPHEHGSSHGLSRLIRLCYYEHPDYVPLLRESYRLWNLLQATTTSPLLRITGGLYVGRPEDPFIEGSRQSAVHHGLAHEVLSNNEVAERFPQFRLEPGEVGFHEPTTGVLFPEHAIEAQLREAQRFGAAISLGERVLEWRSRAGGLTVITDRRQIEADAVIACAGPWMPSLVPGLAERLAVTRQVLAWFRPSDPALLQAGRMPAWAVSEPDGSAHYGFPMFPAESTNLEPPGGAGFKLALHRRGEVADPDRVDRAVREDELASLARFLRDRIPAALDSSGETLRTRVCLYTNTVDQHFLVDRHPQEARVVVVSACSGHGFKLSPAVGAAAADLAVDGRTSLPIEFLRWR